MKLNNDRLFEQTVFVEEDEKDEAINKAKEMIKFAKKNKYLFLAANQIGDNRNYCVVKDGGKFDGYNIYINIVHSDSNCDSNNLENLSLASQDIRPIDIVSFSNKKIMVNFKSKMNISLFSVEEDEIKEFEVGADDAGILWQCGCYILNGVNRDDLVDKDYLTIKGSSKKKPNGICPECGMKNKKCLCVIEDVNLFDKLCII